MNRAPSKVEQGSDAARSFAEGRTASIPSRSLIVRHVTISLVFLVIYALLDRPGVILVSKLGFTSWYPPVGLSVALLLGVSPWYAPLVWIASALSGALIYHQPVLSWSGTLGALSTAGFYAAAAYLLRGPLQIDIGMKRQRDVLRYVSVTLLAAVGVNLVNAACLVADGTISLGQYRHAAFMRFTGDAVALVAVAPFILIHLMTRIRPHLLPSSAGDSPQTGFSIEGNTPSLIGGIAEALAQLASMVLVLWIMFGSPLGSLQLLYLAFLPILWIAMRQGVGQVVNGILAFNFGVVIALDLIPVSLDLLTRIGLLMLVVSATGLIVGAAVSERHLVGRDLSARSTFLNALIENNPLGIVVLDRDGRVQLCNDAFENLLFFRRKELVGRDLDSLIAPPDGTQQAGELTSLVASGPQTQRCVRRMRKDGSVVDVEVNAVPLVLGRYVQGSFGIYKDISEEIRAAEEVKRNAESLNALVGELQLRTNQMTLLNEMSGLLQSCGSRGEAYAVVGQSARKLFPVATAGALFVFKSSRTGLEAAATWGQTCVSEPEFTPGDCWGLRRGEPNWSEHPGDMVACAHLKNAVAASYLCVPLVAQGDPMGILHLQYDRTESTRGSEVFETLQDSQKRLAVSVAAQIALSLANLRMRETLQEQSIRDPLTGLYNRRFMKEALDREVQRAKRGRRSLSVALIDLDHFKHFNDSFGHEAGDEVLHAMAGLFCGHFRSNDIICRYGGEEFTAILPESTAKEAVVRANELRDRAKNLVLHYENRSLNTVTLSIGIAAFPENGTTAEELLRAADICLYQSKRGGRDRVTTPDSQKPAGSALLPSLASEQ
jgi:diguanylate cyclase (GGDEF)-like protein/PAS domain S-box-containing protein